MYEVFISVNFRLILSWHGWTRVTETKGKRKHKQGETNIHTKLNQNRHRTNCKNTKILRRKHFSLVMTLSHKSSLGKCQKHESNKKNWQAGLAHKNICVWKNSIKNEERAWPCCIHLSHPSTLQKHHCISSLFCSSYHVVCFKCFLCSHLLYLVVPLFPPPVSSSIKLY